MTLSEITSGRVSKIQNDFSSLFMSLKGQARIALFAVKNDDGRASDKFFIHVPPPYHSMLQSFLSELSAVPCDKPQIPLIPLCCRNDDNELLY
jgi:hypothetical protein